MADQDWKADTERKSPEPEKSFWSSLVIILLVLAVLCIIISVSTGNYQVFQAIGLIFKALSLIFRFL